MSQAIVPPAPRHSRRERQKREREQRILDAASAVFADKGFHHATVHDVAVVADVADGTIYNYFENKLDLLIAIMARVAELEQLPAELVESLQGDMRAFVVAAFRQRMDNIVNGEEMLRAILPHVLVDPDLRQRFYRQYVLRVARLLEPYIQAQVDLGRLRPVDVRLTTRLLQCMFMGLLVMRIFGDETVQSGWNELPDLLAALIFDGFAERSGT